MVSFCNFLLLCGSKSNFLPRDMSTYILDI